MRRLERVEATLLDEPRDVRQLALGHEPPDQIRVHTVEAEDDELLTVRAGRLRAARHGDGDDEEHRDSLHESPWKL
jgi:hypothetical protein